MKIARIEDLHADFGWRTLSFLKVATDNGIVGWSEYYEGAGNRGLTAAIRALGQSLIGQDAGPTERLIAHLNGQTIQAIGGINQQAVGALVNALLDIKAKDLGVPVYALLGGPIRDRLRVYWSHCGSTRVRSAKHVGKAPLRTYDDVAALGQEVVAAGYTALKTKIGRAHV